VHDDYPRALAEAKRTGRLLFVDAWAPWCHSCQSMRAFVLTDPALAPLANDFVWLAVDTEKDENVAFTRGHGNRVWPTLWVIDPKDESAVLRWEGTATAPELVELLSSVRTKDPSRDAFARANVLAARGDGAGAEHAYRAAMAVQGSDRPRAVEAYVALLAARKDHAACADAASAEAEALPPGTSRAAVVATGLSCARDANHRATDALAALAERIARDPDARTAADDRSALFEELVETKRARGDDAGAKELARSWAAFLEAEAARATSNEARAVFDPHRLSAYVAAGDPARAIPMLRASERDFPNDYNPPARLARAYLELRQLEEARAAIGRAAARVYGPRSLRVLALAADIAKARGDAAEERHALEQALARTASGVVMNEGQQKLRASLEERLARLPR